MTPGNIGNGLLKAILDVVREEGEDGVHDADRITYILKKKGHWGNRTPKTPERTVNMYFSQNPQIFDHEGPNMYCLRPEYRISAPQPPAPPKTAKPKPSQRRGAIRLRSKLNP